MDTPKEIKPIAGAITHLTKLDRVSSVFLVINDNKGALQGIIGCGENQILANALRTASEQIPSYNYPVIRSELRVGALGQDAYIVQRDYILSIGGIMFSHKWSEVKELAVTLPSDAVYTFVISY